MRELRVKGEELQGFFSASGSLVSKNLVVTAASVFVRSTDVELFTALPGATDFTEFATSYYDKYGVMEWLKVTRIFIHPYYKNPVNNLYKHPSTGYIEYNVAMVRLKLDISTNIIAQLTVLCLPVPHQTRLEDLTNLIDNKGLQQGRKLRTIPTSIMSNSECSEDYVTDQFPNLGEMRYNI